MRRRFATSLACLVLGALTFTAFAPDPHEAVPEVARSIAPWVRRALQANMPESDGEACEADAPDRQLARPTGALPSLACDDARRIVTQARVQLAAEAPRVAPANFAEAAADWLDPHGLWSAAPDAPVGPAIKREAARLVADLEAPVGTGPCSAALVVGEELARWSAELRRAFDAAAANAPTRIDLRRAWTLASSTPFEDGAVTHSGRALVREIGKEVGTLSAAYGPSLNPFVHAARARTTPELEPDAWAKVVLAAAVRAYVPQLDAHGAWAPLEEELSIYDLGLEADPPERFWKEMTRTAVGVRIDGGALPPLRRGDVVLAIGDVALAGVSMEQAEQLSVVPDLATPPRLQVLRARTKQPMTLTVHRPTSESRPIQEPGEPEDDDGSLPVEFLKYGEGRAAVIAIPDVPDDLGARVEAAVALAKSKDARGILLDLRANGGGSTDGAIAAIGVFLPGVPLFPMKRRDGAIEVERSPDVPVEARWTGPLAVLVDGDSASAAEMIAGALGSYRRAAILGDQTYGKGCAQEYLDDEAHAGVLRLTTLLYALPDGSAVQKTGIAPNIKLPMVPATEREAAITRALAPWQGPDVRDGTRGRDVAWPGHAGRIGPCKDAMVCRALRAVGTSPAAALR